MREYNQRPDVKAKRLAIQELARQDPSYPERQRAYDRKSRAKNATGRRQRDRNRRQAEAAKTIAAYGGRCALCGNDNPLHLELHHPNFDGGEARRADPTAVRSFRWARLNGYPDSLQLLCANCHLAQHRQRQMTWQDA